MFAPGRPTKQWRRIDEPLVLVKSIDAARG